jgi:hypothetical protein
MTASLFRVGTEIVSNDPAATRTVPKGQGHEQAHPAEGVGLMPKKNLLSNALLGDLNETPVVDSQSRGPSLDAPERPDLDEETGRVPRYLTRRLSMRG